MQAFVAFGHQIVSPHARPNGGLQSVCALFRAMEETTIIRRGSLSKAAMQSSSTQAMMKKTKEVTSATHAWYFLSAALVPHNSLTSLPALGDPRVSAFLLIVAKQKGTLKAYL